MEYLSHHKSAAYMPRIQTSQYKASLARAALKHIPGAEEVIRQTFEPKVVPRQIKPAPVQNLQMHTGFIMN